MLSSVDREVLIALLIGGDDTPANLSDIADRHYQSVQKRLSELEEMGLVVSKGRGVYSLTIEGAQTARALYRETPTINDLDFDREERSD